MLIKTYFLTRNLDICFLDVSYADVEMAAIFSKVERVEDFHLLELGLHLGNGGCSDSHKYLALAAMRGLGWILQEC